MSAMNDKLAVEVAAHRAETARRKFMQVSGRCLGWGLVGPNNEPGVQFTDDSGFGPYQPYHCLELYADHGGDRDAAERAVIDKAMRELATAG